MPFTKDHHAFRHMVRDVVEREIAPHVGEWERAGAFPAHELFPLLGKLGLPGLEYDPAYGGADHLYTVILGEEIGRIDCGGVPMAIGVQAGWICLLARTSGEDGYRGMSQIIVEAGRPGFSVSRKLDKLGNRSSDTAGLVFTGLRVPVASTIGEIGRGFQQQMTQFQNERMIAAYTAVGGAQRALDRTRDYLRKRQASGRPLTASSHVSHRLAELSARIDLLRHCNYACAEAYIRGEDATRFATIAKLAAGRLSREVADTCLQFHGGMGYMEETWTARYFRDSRLISIGGGAGEVMLRVLTQLDGLTP
ncbi:MAG TPA: acyl-CoA dehydrogenase family protein [Streptosporangiaceae bacterium]|nr:acyl-CoA dehydrogenase family protein [Streptosporangiaceae bacterium]